MIDSERLCSCGTFAIGRCTECMDLVCGDHSSLMLGRRLCSAHAAEHTAEARAAEHNTKARAVAERRRERIDAWREWIELATQRLGAIESHPARIVTLVGSVNPVPDPKHETYRLPHPIATLMQSMVGSAEDLMGNPPWKQADIAEWFVRASKTRPTLLKVRRRRQIRWRGERIQDSHELGWDFPGGATKRMFAGYDTVRLLETGETAWPGQPVAEPRQFNAVALCEMRRQAALPALPPHPTAKLLTRYQLDGSVWTGYADGAELEWDHEV